MFGVVHVRCDLGKELGLLVSSAGAEDQIELILASPQRRCQCVAWSFARGQRIRVTGGRA